jgi:hypothetical protein
LAAKVLTVVTGAEVVDVAVATPTVGGLTLNMLGVTFCGSTFPETTTPTVEGLTLNMLGVTTTVENV